MIAKIQLKLNNDVLLTVIKMIKHTDDYIVENLTDALLISIKEDLINKLEDKAKTIQKQVSILDHNKKHSLVLKYHEAYSLYKLLDAVYEKQLFSDNLHIKKIKRLITELNNKLDIFAKEEDITIIDEDPLEETTTENLPGKILVLEGSEEDTNQKVEQIEMPILFDFSEAFAGEQEEINTTEETAPVLEETTVLEAEVSSPLEVSEEISTEIELTTELIQEETTETPNTLETEDNILEVADEATATIETLEETTPEVEMSSKETFPTQETIYDTESDLFMSAIPESQPKLDWERITTEDQVEADSNVNTKEKVAFSNPIYNELFNIAKTGINVDAEDLVVKPSKEETTKEEEPIQYTKASEEIPQAKDVMQIEIFDLETIEADQAETKPKKEKKKEKKATIVESIGQISLF